MTNRWFIKVGGYPYRPNDNEIRCSTGETRDAWSLVGKYEEKKSLERPGLT